VKALLLSAGLGTRLRPITKDTPKCLVPIKGKPLIEIWLDNLSNAGYDSFLINTHYLAHKVEAFINQSKYRGNVKLVHETTLLGTAGTLNRNLHYFENKDGLLAHSDNYCTADFDAFYKAHKNRPKQCLITMMTFETSKPENCGIIKLDSEQVVIDFHEKPSSPLGNLANGAIYMLSREFLEMFPANFTHTRDFSTEVIPNILGKIFTYRTGATLIDVGNLKTYHDINRT
tara:strand:+ start:664 stop:1353 length:690 start_codon:yes stop_codon:yes gene_type:complete